MDKSIADGNIELYEEIDKDVAFDNFEELKKNKFIESAAFGNWTLIDSILPLIPDVPDNPITKPFDEGEEIPEEWYDEPEEDDEDEEEDEEYDGEEE